MELLEPLDFSVCWLSGLKDEVNWDVCISEAVWCWSDLGSVPRLLALVALSWRSSADVLHCSAVQVTLSLYSCGSAFKKIAKNGVPLHTGLNAHTLLMKLLLCLTVSCIAVICCSFYGWENWLCLYVTTEDQLEYFVSVFVVIARADFTVWTPLSSQWIALTPEKKKYPSKQLFSSLFDVGLAHLLCVRTHHQFLCWVAVSVGSSFPKRVLRTHFIWRHADLWIGVEMSVVGKGR